MQHEQRTLSDGLILRSPKKNDDVDKYVALHEAVVGEGTIASRLLRHFPNARPDDFLVVEDPQADQFVSASCLLPWKCQLDALTLDVAMLEMIATRPEHRRQGLVRAQIDIYHRRVAERHFDLSIIQGIPYYYRQFGYAYAIDHWARDSLPTYRIPDWDDRLTLSYSLRQATTGDIGDLTRLYRQAMSPVQVHMRRSGEYWRYLIEHAAYPVAMIESPDETMPAGYVALREPEGVARIDVVESCVTSLPCARAVLRHLKQQSADEIRLYWPQDGTLVRLARSFRSTPEPRYQWLARITDTAALLRKMKPVFEERVAGSPCPRLTQPLILNTYHHTAFKLEFVEGRLNSVEELGFVDASNGEDGGDLCIPPEAFVRLILGYRSLAELRDAWPDIDVKAADRDILDILFPRMSSCVLTPY